MKKIGKIGSNIVHTFAILAGAMIFVWGMSTLGVKLFVALGWEWVSVSDVGMIIIGIGIMLFMLLSDYKMGRIFDRYYAEWEEDPEVAGAGGSAKEEVTEVAKAGGSAEEEVIE